MKLSPIYIETDKSVKPVEQDFWKNPENIMHLIDLIFLNDDSETMPS